MDLFTQATGSVWGFLSVAVPFLFVLTVVVFIHELGHFLVARWCGVNVKAFSIGFGREIWGFTDKHGTRWKFAWIPLGGYVRFMDDENGASMPSREAQAKMTPEERAGSFHTKSLSQKSAIVAAGPIANFLLAILIYAGLAWTMGVQVTQARVDQIVPGSAAEQAGFKVGDVISAIDGTTIQSFGDMQRIVHNSPDMPLSIVIDRGGTMMTLQATPQWTEVDDGFGGKAKIGRIGISRNAGAQEWQRKSFGPIEALAKGVEDTYYNCWMTLKFVGDIIKRKQSAEQLGGPARIADVAGQVAKHGIIPLIGFIAFISVSIGLINLFPIPVLDGGHLMFYAIEAIRREPLSERAQDIGFRIGFALLIALMVFANYNDLNIFKRWFGLG
jgi:regulator of sigma E protease